MYQMREIKVRERAEMLEEQMEWTGGMRIYDCNTNKQNNYIYIYIYQTALLSPVYNGWTNIDLSMERVNVSTAGRQLTVGL